MPKIQLKPSESIQEFIQNIYPNAIVKLLHPLPQAIKQHGQTCKLYALSVAMNYEFIKNPVQQIPPAARKRDIFAIESQVTSLRKRAKALGSQVGEIYDGKILLQLAMEHGYQRSEIIEPTKERYVEEIIAQINQAQAPIVFFDVNLITGEPENQGSNYEHAAVVVGYFIHEKQCHFVLAQWGQYYYVHAEKLRDSANQLARKRAPEEFHKINGAWIQANNSLGGNDPILAKRDKHTTHSVISEPLDYSFKNKLLIVRSSTLELIPALPIQQQSHNDSHNLSYQLNGVEFLRLDRLINFLEVDTIRPNSYSAEELKLFADRFNFQKQLLDLTRHTAVDESLEDDIYRQNPKRTRSITELTSNAIDAQSKNIYIKISDGTYQILDFGLGMSPEVIFRKLLIPKASTKEDAQDSIGQFGLGFYTALAHLVNFENRVIVRTKALAHSGYRIEFRKIENKICINISQDTTMAVCGTEITVSSEQINKELFIKALIQNIRYFNRATISINGVIANRGDICCYAVSKSSVILDYEHFEQSSTLTLAGVTIQSEENKESTNALHVVWNLDKSLVSISESRNQVRLVSKEARKEVCTLIDFADSLADDLKIKYVNAIAAMVYNLQQNNTSQKRDDNVFYYLQTKINQLYADKKQVPDLQLLKPLMTEGRVVLHPLLVNPYWQKLVGFVPREWQADPIDENPVKVVVVAMDPKFDERMIHDEHTNTIYLNLAFYQHIKDPAEFELLALLFSLPPEKIRGQWKPVDDKQNVSSISTSVALEAVDQTGKPHHSLYKKHGILAHYGDHFVNNLSDEQRALFIQAQTLMQIYPMHRDMLPNESQINQSVRGYQKLIPFTAYGKAFYLARSNWSQALLILLDHTFKQLLHRDDLLIYAKAVQLYQANKLAPHMNVTLEQKDRLLVINAAKKYTEVYSGSKELCFAKKFSFSAELILLNAEYFMVVEGENTYVYNRKNELVVHLPESYSQKVSDNPLQIAASFSSKITYKKGIYCISSQRDLIPHSKENNIRLFANHYLNLRRTVDEAKSKLFVTEYLNSFDVITTSGNISYTYTSRKLFDIDFVESKQVNNQYFITLQYSNYERELLILNPNNLSAREKNADTGLALEELISTEHIFGYPAHAFLRSNTSGGLSLYFINRSHVIENITYHTCFGKNLPRTSYGHNTYDPLNNKEIALIEYQKNDTVNRIIVDGDQIIPLPIELVGLKVSTISKQYNFYKIFIESERNEQFIINNKGDLLVTGDRINHEKTEDHDIFLVNSRLIMRGDGIILLDNERIKYIHVIPKLNMIKITFRKNEGTATEIVIDCDGRAVIPETSEDINSHDDGRLSYRLNGKKYIISREGHFQQFKHLYLTNHTLAMNTAAYEEQRLYFYEDGGKRYLIDGQGNALFLEGLQNAYTLGDIITTYKYGGGENLFLAPLSPQQLILPAVQENIKFLNTRELSPLNYGSCLRFVTLEPSQFKVLYPYMAQLVYLPMSKQVDEYIEFLKYIQDELIEHQYLLVNALNLIYSIAGSYVQFNLASKLFDLFSLYGIYFIERTYKELLEQRDIIVVDPDGITTQDSLIRELSIETGMVVYYLFFDGKDLFSQNSILLNYQSTTEPVLSLINLLIAQRLDASIVNDAANRAELMTRISQLTQATTKHHAERRMMHAIYHQAPPEKCLYLREFIQNALDAYADSGPCERLVDIDLTVNSESECVLSLKDSGIGMTPEQVFKYLLIPGMSSKRHAISGKFIGGRGVGLFTAFHGAKEIIIKTSAEEGKTTYLLLKPQYKELKNGELQVMDVAIDWYTQDEIFHGTIIQRISLDSNVAHEAAKYHRAIGTHAKFIDRSEFSINLNGKRVNDKLIPLLEFHLPEVGKVIILKSNEKAITAGGLFVKDLSEDLPDFIKRVFDKNALVIQLPKGVALNRERNDFQDSEQFTAHLKTHLPQALYGAYLSLVFKSEATLDEISYDLYNKIFERLDAMTQRNPDVVRDAFILNLGGSLRDYTKYRNSELLTDLMCFLKVIDYKENEQAEPRKESIVNLGLLHQRGQLRKEQVPAALSYLIHFDQSSKKRIKLFYEETDSIALFRNLQWQAIPGEKTPHLNLFIELSQKIVSILTREAIGFGFSTCFGGALAYVSKGQNRIYWNVINLFKEPYLERLFELNQLRSMPYSHFMEVVRKLIYVISHELTHIDDAASGCTGTHNHAFYLRQRTLLSKHLIEIDTAALYEHYVALCNRDLINQPLLNAVACVKAYLTPFISEIEQLQDVKMGNNYGFFSNKIPHAQAKAHETLPKP